MRFIPTQIYLGRLRSGARAFTLIVPNQLTMKITITLITTFLLAIQLHAKPLKVFILAGQSNMEGQGSVDHDGDRKDGKGNLVWSMKFSKSAEKMKKLKNEKADGFLLASRDPLGVWLEEMKLPPVE